MGHSAHLYEGENLLFTNFAM